MQPGDLIGGRFRIDRHLGRSRRGEVWLAADEAAATPREVEAVRLGGLEGEAALRLLTREVEVGRRLDDATGALRALAYGVAPGGEVWVAREHAAGAAPLDLDGGDLLARVDRIARAARAVAALHAQGAVHRDLGPHALLAAPDGAVLVAGLALARLDGLDEPPGPWTTALAAPACAAPEVLDRPERAAPAADVHALGALLFRAVAGAWPRGAGLVEVARAQERARADGAPPDLRAVRPDAPAALAALCAGALALDPAARAPASAAALAAALDAWRVEATAPVAPPPGEIPPPPPPPQPAPPVAPPPDPLFVPEEARRPPEAFEGLTALRDGAAPAVLVLALPPKAIERTVVSLRALDPRGAAALLVDMRRVEHLGGAQLEALTELLTLSERRGLPIALFGLSRALRQLLRILELGPHVPPVLAADEPLAAAEALRARA